MTHQPPAPGSPHTPGSPDQPQPYPSYPTGRPEQAYAGGSAYPPAPTQPLEYHQLYRAGRPGQWHLWGIASPFLSVGFLLLFPVLLLVPVVIWLVATGQPAFDIIMDQATLEDVSPASLGFLLFALACSIPFAFAAVRLLHGLRPRWLSSVGPGLRWRYLFACSGVAVIALIATLVVSVLLPSGQVTGAEMSGELNEFDRELQMFALIVLLLTPLQAAGEEYLFRGYLTQGIGGLFSPERQRTLSRIVAVGLPALLFAIAHGSQSVPVFFDRFAFGVVAGILVIRTGGLEAAIAMHVLNNWLAFSFALAFGDLGESLTPTGGSWWTIPATLTQSLVYLFLAVKLADRMGLSRRADPAVLAASRTRV